MSSSPNSSSLSQTACFPPLPLAGVRTLTPGFGVIRLVCGCWRWVLLGRRFLRGVGVAWPLTGEEKSSELSWGASGSGLESGESSRAEDHLSLGVAVNLERDFSKPLPSGVAWTRYVLSSTRCMTGSVDFWCLPGEECFSWVAGGTKGEREGEKPMWPFVGDLPGVAGRERESWISNGESDSLISCFRVS